MDRYDPLGLYGEKRYLGARSWLSETPSETNKGRTDAYGMPNMGGKGVSRKNETPSRDDWLKSEWRRFRGNDDAGTSGS
jgi:hypothetical protein